MEFDPVRCITKKRDGQSLSESDIACFLRGYTRDEIPDYQMSALAMAIYLRGMSKTETSALTRIMLEGQHLKWPGNAPPIVDKHSTGGIGDKVSLVLAPLLACCDLWVPMLSGRGLGPTGGTLDKLESIPGFRTNLSIEEIQQITARVGCVITGASEQVAPADRKLYALRDVTATVPSIPLITASIMSKKLSESLKGLVLDVKFGAGAFMKEPSAARSLAESLVETGQSMHVATTALLTDMNQPLGRAIGNTLEVNESVDTLRGEGPKDLVEITLALGGELLCLAGASDSVEAGCERLHALLSNGDAYDKFSEMVRAQGGNLEHTRPIANRSVLTAPRSGYLHAIDNERLGYAVIELGGGRRTLGEAIDHATGMEILVRIGDRVEIGQPLLHIFAHPQQTEPIHHFVRNVFQIHDEAAGPVPLITERIRGSNLAD